MFQPLFLQAPAALTCLEVDRGLKSAFQYVDEASRHYLSGTLPREPSSLAVVTCGLLWHCYSKLNRSLHSHHTCICLLHPHAQTLMSDDFGV